MDKSWNYAGKGCFALFAILCLCTGGCRTANQHRIAADKAANGVIEEYQKKALDKPEPFTIEQPSIQLRKRLMLEQKLPASTNTAPGTLEELVPRMPDPMPLSMIDALRVAARNSRKYQSAKETVFKAALSLDLERDQFRNSYAGLVSSMFSSSDNDDDEKSESVKHSANAGVTRKLQTGATLSAKLAIDIISLLTGDATSSLGIIADATISIPLLKGAGKSIAREPLTQAERGVIYAIWELERFKQSFAVDITSSYLGVLQKMEEEKNAEGNYERIKKTRARADRLGEAGRLDNIQVDQARQNELRAQNQLVSARQAVQASLDNFKTRLGLPADARIQLDIKELDRIADSIAKQIEPGKVSGSNQVDQAFIATALSSRLDMRITMNRFQDTERAVAVARDNLLSDVKLKASASLDQTDSDKNESDESGNKSKTTRIDYSGALEIDLPWEKTAERNAYRNSLLSLEQARRDIEEKEDEVKLSVRQALRNRLEAGEAYKIQLKARQLAETRVRSVNLFQDAGRATIRDSLEAEDALVSAQNAAVAALVSCRLAEFNLRRDMGTIEVDTELRIKEE